MADNYLLQLQSAQKHFLTYDQEALIRKCHLKYDDNWLYTRMLGLDYRLCRTSGSLQRLEKGRWVDANTFGQVMTLLDLLCDSRADRFATGQFTAMENLGNLVHSNLLGGGKNPLAELFDREPERMAQICRALGGQEISAGDLGFSFPVFEELCVQLRFWASDEDFPASARWFWDKNALSYLRYETTFYAIGFLSERLQNAMACVMINTEGEKNGV